MRSVPEATPPRVTRFTIPAVVMPNAYASALAISPDGTRFACISDRGFTVRSALTGSNPPSLPPAGPAAWARRSSRPTGSGSHTPDGRVLMKVPADGGPAVEIVESGPALRLAAGQCGHCLCQHERSVPRVAGWRERPAARCRARPQRTGDVSSVHAGRQRGAYRRLDTHQHAGRSGEDRPGARVVLLDLAGGVRRTLLRGGGRVPIFEAGISFMWWARVSTPCRSMLSGSSCAASRSR